MATTMSPIKATPYSVVYHMIGDGSEGTRTGVQILSDLATAGVKGSPIYQLISRRINGAGGVGSSNILDRLNLDGSDSGLLRARFVTGINNATPAPASMTVRWTTDSLSANLTNLGEIYLEFRLQHSSDR